MRWWIFLFVCALSASAASPVDFGLREVDSALASRNLKWKIKYELNLEGPETYRIEPYGYAGGHVTGGDMRGLMYGLLEAADQIRATGRLALVHSTPAIPSRAVRVFVADGDLHQYSEDYWREYFQTLARSRLNRFYLVFLSPNSYSFLVDDQSRDRNLRMLRFLSQTAAEYAVDFTPGFWTGSETPPAQPEHDALLKLLAECPSLRSVQLRAPSADAAAYRETIFKALHEVGHRVALDPLGALDDSAIAKAAEESGVALAPSKSWPPGFVIDPPAGAGHEIFYWMWGRLAYDPKTKPPHTLAAAEFHAASQIVAELRRGLLTAPYLSPEIHPAPLGGEPNDFVATMDEAVRNRVGNIASAKQTPLDVADSLSAFSALLDKSDVPDFQLLASLARYHAHRLRAVYDLEIFDQLKNPAALDRAAEELKSAADSWKPNEAPLEDVRVFEAEIAARRSAPGADSSKEIPEPLKTPARPQITHAAVKIVAPGAPITLTIQITPAKEVRAVRLHYRVLDAHDWKTIEKQTAPLAFTIPADDLEPDSQFVYYFEILNRENTGWFEPDPATAIPYHWVRVPAPPQ